MSRALHEVCYIYTTTIAGALGSLESQGLLQRRLFQAGQARGDATEMDESRPPGVGATGACGAPPAVRPVPVCTLPTGTAEAEAEGIKAGPG